jgi:hypothetical protein
MRDADLRTVQELGGWKSLNMVQRYAPLIGEHNQKAVELHANNSPSIIPAPLQSGTIEESRNLKLVKEMGR